MASRKGRSLANPTGAWGWHHTSLAVNDLDGAIAFYRGVFGYEVIFEERSMTDQIQSMVGLPGLIGDIAQLRSPISGHVLELIAFRQVPAGREDHGPTRPGTAHVAFKVADLDRALQAMRQFGAELIGEITQFSEGRAVYCREPSGTVFELEEVQDHEGGDE